MENTCSDRAPSGDIVLSFPARSHEPAHRAADRVQRGDRPGLRPRGHRGPPGGGHRAEQRAHRRRSTTAPGWSCASGSRATPSSSRAVADGMDARGPRAGPHRPGAARRHHRRAPPGGDAMATGPSRCARALRPGVSPEDQDVEARNRLVEDHADLAEHFARRYAGPGPGPRRPAPDGHAGHGQGRRPLRARRGAWPSRPSPAARSTVSSSAASATGRGRCARPGPCRSCTSRCAGRTRS